MDAAARLLASFHAALAAADPLTIVARHLPNWADLVTPDSRIIVIGAGKAAASMAMAVERAWPDAPLEGLVVTRYDHGGPTTRIRVVEASHPVPDAAGEQAARDMLALVESARPHDLVLALISGGGSALLALPVESVSADDLRAVTRELLRCGAPIGDINCVRKHVSRIAGGRLAQACAGRLIALAISDVAGDDLSAIASGPTVPDPTTFADALHVLARWDVQAPQAVRAHLEAGTRGLVAETPKASDPCFARVQTQLIASAQAMLEAAQAFWQTQHCDVLMLGEIEGEARDVARAHAQLVSEHANARAHKTARPLAIVSGGECTVTVRGHGRGGRCSEYLLHLAIALDELGLVDHVSALACDTDGIDGSENNAGAWFTPAHHARAKALGLDARVYANNNDAYGYFSVLDALITTGPTRTNVNDYRVILHTRAPHV
ncbi:MAG TPA: glycerate kinase [Burkholderiaceae bacterium]|nr:glycerate kinase [Burkholderiaceae bacterium]